MSSFVPARAASLVVAAGLLLAGLVGVPAAADAATPAAAATPTTASAALATDQLTVPPSALGRAAAEPAAPATAPVVHTVWVSTVSATASTADDTVTSIDRASIDAAVSSLHDYWWEESGHRVDVRLGGVEQRSLGQASCDAPAVLAATHTAAFGGAFSSYRWAGTEKHLLVLPREACGTRAFATIGGDGGEILTSYGLGTQLGVPVLLHEFGHNLGFGHAGTALCRSTTSYDGALSDFRSGTAAACPTEEYGDRLDLMGYSVSGARPHVSAAQRLRAGWLPDARVLSTPGTTTRVVVPSLDSAGPGRALDVVDPVSGLHYVVEYRTATGTDRSSAEFSGGTPSCAVVAPGYTKCDLTSSAATGSVRVLRALPQAGGSATTVALAVGTDAAGDPTRRDTHLDAGDSFTSAAGGFTVTVASVTPAGGAVLDVVLRTAAGAVPTTTTATLSSATRAYGTAGTTVTTAVARADGRPATGTVRITDGGTVVATVRVGTGGQATATLPTTLAAGSHAIRASFVPGDAAASGSTSAPRALAVTAGATTTTLALSGTTQSWSTTRPVVATATVGRVGGAWPAGTVTFSRGGVPVATVTAVSGSASWTLPATTPTGSSVVTASFRPTDASLTASTSAAQTVVVTQAASTTAVALSATTVPRGTAATATVTVRVPGVVAPAGSVTVLVDGRAVQTAVLTAASRGVVTVALPNFTTPGSPAVSVRYKGTSDVAPSTSATAVLTVS